MLGAPMDAAEHEPGRSREAPGAIALLLLLPVLVRMGGAQEARDATAVESCRAPRQP